MSAPAASLDDVIRIEPASRLRGQLTMPGDKSISHRALLLATLATGQSRITGAGDGQDVRSTVAVCGALGAVVERMERLDGSVDYTVTSPGVDGLVEPDGILDCGNAGTTLRLAAGVIAGLPMYAVLDGDRSLRRRPVARIIEPLRSMGAVLHARRRDSLPPLTVVGRTPLRAIEYGTPVPSAQVKSAILLAGLRAEGVTTVIETVATRDHTERMLRARGVAVSTEPTDRGLAIAITGGTTVAAHDERVPGDISAAAFWLVGASIHPDAAIAIRDVGVNPTRRAVLDILRSMGAAISEDGPEASEADREPVADLAVRSAGLIGTDVSPADAAPAIDEIPILCLAATQAEGRTTIRGVGELRVKESDRMGGIVAGLRAFGARIVAAGDDIVVDGPTPLHGAAVDAAGDHRMAMTYALASLIASGPTTIAGAGSAAVSYPGFFADLEAVRR